MTTTSRAVCLNRISMIDISEALEAGAQAGDGSLTDMSLGRPALSSSRRVHAFRNSLKRFCESLPGDVTLEEVFGRYRQSRTRRGPVMTTKPDDFLSLNGSRFFSEKQIVRPRIVISGIGCMSGGGKPTISHPCYLQPIKRRSSALCAKMVGDHGVKGRLTRSIFRSAITSPDKRWLA